MENLGVLVVDYIRSISRNTSNTLGTLVRVIFRAFYAWYVAKEEPVEPPSVVHLGKLRMQ